MPQSKYDSRELRQSAEDVFQKFAEREKFAEDERADLVTSLVRQWISYEGRATLFVGERPFHFAVSMTPLGHPVVDIDSQPRGWAKILTVDWRIDPEELPDLFAQLNRGQSAEATNRDGEKLRLWVNPKERSEGIEPLTPKTPPPGHVRDYRRLAARALEQHFGKLCNAEEIDALAKSVVEQWEKFDGHASIFANGHTQLLLRNTENDDGTGSISVSKHPVDVEGMLAEIGFPAAGFREMIVRFNLGQSLEVQDSTTGRKSRFWHDPKARAFRMTQFESEPATGEA